MNNIEKFFNDIASSWDNMEIIPFEHKKWILDQVNIKENDLVLDIACGTGVISKMINDISKNKVIGIDISKNMIDIAKAKYKDDSSLTFIHIDLFDLDESNKYDLAIIYNAYPHFLEPTKLSNKLSKILKENGRFAILHSLSRADLEKHHSSVSNISRSLKEPEIEFDYFKNEFKLEKAIEGDNFYILIGVKK